MQAGEQALLVVVLEDRVFVEFAHFALQADRSPEIALALGIPARLMTAGSGGATFLSGGTDHYAAVRMELWTSEPGIVPNGWEMSETGTLHIDTWGVRLTAVTAAASTQVLDLPGPGTYGIRSHSVGRDAAAALGEASYADGVERWLLQLWPRPPRQTANS